jgi:hypothetical protein
MKVRVRSFVFGILFASLLLTGGLVAVFFLMGPQIRTIFHDQRLPSGKVIKVTMCNFAWGVDHADRHGKDDCFVLEYVSTVPHTDLALIDRETLEAFELIRPISELWGLDVANVSAFPSVRRKGHYFLYIFSRNSDGKWTFERKPAKVFIND